MEINEDTTEETTPVIEDPKAVLEALENAKREAKQFRQQRDSYKAQVENNPWRERAIKAEARNSLREQGVKDPDRILKYMSLEGIEADDEGGLVGIDDRIEEVKGDFPELFDVKRQVGNKADIFAGGGNTRTEKSATELQADILLGR